MASKVLIINAVSPIGQAIYKAFESCSFAVLTPVKNALDWEDGTALATFIKENDVSVIINTAGWNECPTQQQQKALLKAAKAIAAAAKKTDCAVIHLSSYRVFGGENQSAYDELDIPSPLDAAGETFLQAEETFEQELERYICLRVSWVLDIVSDSVFRRLLQDLTSDGVELEFTHQYRGAPVSTAEIGSVVLAMVNQIYCGSENWGVFHLASGDPCTSAELSEVVAEILERKGVLRRSWRIQRLDEAQSDTGSGPVSAALTVRRCRDNFGYQVKSWRQGLSRLVDNWIENQKLNWD